MRRLLRSIAVAFLLALPATIAFAQAPPSPKLQIRPANDNSNYIANTGYVTTSVQILLNTLSGKAPPARPIFLDLVKAQSLSGDGSGLSVTAQGGTTARTTAARAADVANACDFSGSDAGAKIVAAIASLPATGGEVDARCLKGAQTISSALTVGAPTKIVHLRVGHAIFTLSATVLTSAGSSITGVPAGMNIGFDNSGTIFKAANNSNLSAIISVASGGLGVLQDFVVDGNKTGNPSNTTGDGIIFIGSNRPDITRVTTQNAPRYGLNFSTGTANACCGKLHKVMSVGNGLSGLFANQTNDLYISNSEFENNGGYGIEISNSPAARIEHNDMGGNALGGLKAYGTMNGKGSGLLIITGNQFGGNKGHDINIQGANFTAQGPIIANNSFIGMSQSGVSGTYDNIHLQDVCQATINGNYIASYDGGGQSRYGIATLDSAGFTPDCNTVGSNTVVGAYAMAPYFGAQGNIPTSENRIINGDFAYDQYKEGMPNTIVGGYFTDRWMIANNIGQAWQVNTKSTGSGLLGSPTALVLVASGTKSIPATGVDTLTQRIDGADVADLLPGNSKFAKSFVVSFWGKSSIPGAYSLSFNNGSQNRSLVTTVELTPSPKYYSIVVPADKGGSGANGWHTGSGTIGMEFNFDIGSGANLETSKLNIWQNGRFLRTLGAIQLGTAAPSGQSISLNGIRIRAGNQDQPRVTPTVSDDLARARQFYRKSFPFGTAPAQNAGLAGAWCFKAPMAGSFGSIQIPFEPLMRKTPTITTFNPFATNANWRDATAAADVPASVDPYGAISMSGVEITTSATIANAGDNVCIHFTASGEL